MDRDWTRVMKSTHILNKVIFKGSVTLEVNSNLNTTQERTLLGIYDNPGKSQKHIISYLNMDKGAVSKVIQTLVESGLLERKNSVKDRRQVLLSLTPKGQKETEFLHEKYSTHITKVLSVLDESKQQEVYNHLDGLLKLAIEIEEKSL